MEATTPLKAIRLKCLDCSCGSSNEVKQCPITDCPLYEFRTGHLPKNENRKYVDNSRFLIEYQKQKNAESAEGAEQSK